MVASCQGVATDLGEDIGVKGVTMFGEEGSSEGMPRWQEVSSRQVGNLRFVEMK